MKWYHFCWGFYEMAPYLLRIFDPFLTIFIEDFWPFSEMVLFLLRNFDPFLTEMVLFLLRNFDSFQKWYLFCWGILTLFRNGIIFFDEFLHFSVMVLFLLRIFDPFQIWFHFIEDFWPFSDWNGTIFGEEFWPLNSEMVPFLLTIFTLFLNGTIFWRFLTLFWNGSFLLRNFDPFFTIFVDEFWPFSEMVQVSRKFDRFLKWKNEEMVSFFWGGLIFWGFRKSAPTGVILMWYWRDTGLTDCSTYPSHIDSIFFRND